METIELLKNLIAIESINRETSNLAIDFCESWLLKRGISGKIIENNGYKSFVCEIGQGDKNLIFNGHLDVVSAKPEQFHPFERNERLYGRGSADMKAGVAAMMNTIVDLKDKVLPCKVQLQLVSDEETGGLNCSSFLADQGYRGDFVICGECTQLGLGIQAKGILQIDIDVYGKSAHGSRPWRGENAILKAIEYFNKITELPFAKEKSELYDFPSINLSKLSAGDAYNKVPDYCKMSLDIRFLPEQNIEEILKQITQIVGDNINIHSTGEPVKTKIHDKYVQSLSAIVEETLNKSTSIFGQHGSADTRFFSKYGIPAIEFGPVGENCHGAEEYVEINSIYRYEEILKKFALGFK